MFWNENLITMKLNYSGGYMKKIIYSILFTISLSTVIYAQTIKASISFLGTENPVTNTPSTVNDSVQGISVDFDAKIVEKGKFRLGGVFNYQRPVVHNGFNVYSFGPQLSYKIGFVEPFGTALFGFTDTVDATEKKVRVFTRTYRGGVDLNFGNVFIRPFYLQYQFTEGFNVNGTKQYGAGAGVRF
jgi:hypothetical protein